MKTRFILAAVLVAGSLSGCLATVPSIDAQRSINAQTRAQVAKAIQRPKIEADGTLVSPWIRAAMMSAFSMRAEHLGLRIDPNGVPVTIHITSVRSRSDGARMAFNFFDGADYVSGTVDVGDATFEVGENTWLYWAPTGFRSIQDVAEAVGKQVANGVAIVAGEPIEE